MRPATFHGIVSDLTLGPACFALRLPHRRFNTRLLVLHRTPIAFRPFAKLFGFVVPLGSSSSEVMRSRRSCHALSSQRVPRNSCFTWVAPFLASEPYNIPLRFSPSFDSRCSIPLLLLYPLCRLNRRLLCFHLFLAKLTISFFESLPPLTSNVHIALLPLLTCTTCT